MGFSLDVSVPVFTVFLQGLLSFFSPCVLPLLPLYMGYLSSGTGTKDEEGNIHYKHSKVMINTLFFVIGISFAFFILGLGFSAMGTFFKNNQLLFARIGGFIILLFGLYQLGLFGTSTVMGKERRLPFKINTLVMSPITALLMGFTFSFAWTPCVGPALASVLLMVASANTQMIGILLIGVYTIGFVLPFLIVGIFTKTLLEFFKNHKNVVKYTVKIGAILMILMGILMVTGKMNVVTGYLSKLSGTQTVEKDKVVEEVEKEKDTEEDAKKEVEKEESKLQPASDFKLIDQYGNTQTLSQYKGKTVFLNFWATWCPPCLAEMPSIQKIYLEYQNQSNEEVVILGVAAPEYGAEKSEKEIKAFLEEKGYTYPVAMDTTGEIFEKYGVFSYPTTFMIDKDGNVFGYATGQLSEEIMRDIIKQTIEGKRE